MSSTSQTAKGGGGRLAAITTWIDDRFPMTALWKSQVGRPLTGVAATLTTADPYVTIRWNTSSTYPDLAAGAAAANDADWDLALAAEMPPAHTARLGLHVTAANGGPWDLEVQLPVSCPGPLEGVPVAPGDTDGDGTGEVAVAFGRDGSAPVLKVYSGASGQMLTSASLAGAGYVPISATAVPNFAGSGADEVAVLLTAPGRVARVVVIDAGDGLRLKSFALSRTPTHLEIDVIPPAAGASPTLVILVQNPNGTIVAHRRDAATGASLGRVSFGSGLRPAALAVLPGTDGGARLVLVGNDDAGALVAVARRAATGRLTARLSLSSTLFARGAAATAAPGGDDLLVIAAEDPTTGSVHLLSLDPVSGAQAASFLLANLAEARAVASLPDIGGSPARDVAVLGAAADGTLVATVADPLTGSLLSAPEFPGGYLTDDLVALRPGGLLAALGRAPGDGSILSLRHPASGAALATYPIL